MRPFVVSVGTPGSLGIVVEIICAGGVVSTLSAGGIELITISEPLLDGVE